MQVLCPEMMVCLQGMLMSKDFVGPAKNMTVMAFYNK